MKPKWSMPMVASLASAMLLITAGCASQPCRRQPNFGCGTPEAGEGELRGPGGSGGGAGGAGGAAGVLASPLLCAQKHSAALADVVALS